MKVQISKRADADIDAIWSYIAKDNESAADKVEDAMRAAVHKLARNPDIGHRHPSVSTKYRCWGVYSYLIGYRVEGGTLVVVRVVHDARAISVDCSAAEANARAAGRFSLAVRSGRLSNYRVAGL